MARGTGSTRVTRRPVSRILVGLRLGPLDRRLGWRRPVILGPGETAAGPVRWPVLPRRAILAGRRPVRLLLVARRRVTARLARHVAWRPVAARAVTCPAVAQGLVAGLPMAELRSTAPIAGLGPTGL